MTSYQNKMSYLELKNISKSYQGVPTISNINIQIEKGEFVSLVGPSGVGKTTLFNILSGLDQPDQGQVLLQGEEITGQTGKFSYMQQKDLLLPFYQIIDNVSIPLRLQGLSKKEARNQAQAYMEEFGLKGSEKKYPHQISGGMKQRAALLRSYLYSNQLMLLDEPFSALDFFTRASMQAWYRKFSQDHGTTSFLISHDIEEALLLSDKVYIMQGPPGQVGPALVIDRKGMEPDDFTNSTDFLAYKKFILEKIKEAP